MFYEGDLGDCLHLIDKGHVAIRISTPAGDTVTFQVLGPGDTFGEQALLNTHSRRTASAVCLEPTETLSITKSDFEELRERHPNVDRFLVDILSAEVHRLSAMCIENLHLGADTRVARRVHDLAQIYDDGTEPICIPITQEDIASLAGTTRPTVNKTLRSAEQREVLTLGRGRISVTDMAGLARLAGLR